MRHVVALEILELELNYQLMVWGRTVSKIWGNITKVLAGSGGPGILCILMLLDPHLKESCL